MVRIGANIAALSAERALARATNSLARVSERLSSGQRINRASDDAAGLAIASSLEARSRVFGQSLRNVNDAISALSIADGAVGELSGILTRLKELGTQAANGTFSSQQRRALDLEGQTLRNEYNRIVATTRFNGLNIIDDATGTLRIQAGYTANNAALSISASNLGTGGKGLGTFSSTALLSSKAADVIATADFNSDGVLDLIFADGSFQNQFVVRFGNGNGTFKAEQGVGTIQTSAISQLRAVDLNGDGLQDIVAVSSSDASVSMLSNGDGTFKAVTALGGGTSNFQTASTVAAGDLNRDGKMDLVLGYSGDASADVLLGNGDGTFRSTASYSMIWSGSAFDARNFELGDINNDGILDLVGVGFGESNVNVLYGNGNGSFKSPTQFTLNTGGVNNQGLLLSDFDGDGRVDIGVGNLSGSSVMFLLSSKSYSSASEVVVGSAAGGPFYLNAADLNGDGKNDLIFNRSEIAFGNGDGSFGDPVIIPGAGGGSGLAVGDFNGDGVLDLADSLDLVLTDATTTSRLNSFSLATRVDALAALREFDDAPTAIGQARGRIGADQSRLESALATLASTRENFTAARGRIVDADVAAETANLARNQILQQTASAVLSQATQQPSLALLLLRA